jgi:hypothetical protein
MAETTKKTATQRIREAAAQKGVKVSERPGNKGTGEAIFRPGKESEPK